ncbi:hypothetical protein AYJ57_20970 (plasmid) [Salipiger sp. CCB-MM3]|nr:hypothetical protein AYJ57_20970 [Salipiger sp. CCB-MM3]
MLCTAVLLLPMRAEADLLCPGTLVTARAPAESAVEERICAVVVEAAAQLNTCGLPITRPVQILVIDGSLGDGCVGLYHCGEDLIEVLAPDRLEANRSRDGIFDAVPTDRFFDSIIVHELAHAAHDALPCPSGLCLATSEYLAYNSQIMSLEPDDQRAVMARIDMEETVKHDEVNAAILFFKPNVFAARAWAHLNQRDDPCEYLRHVANGVFTFDRERP